MLAGNAGYGFVVKLGEMHSRNRAGKAVLRVPDGTGVLAPVPVPVAEGALLAAVNSDGRLLVFPVSDLPELPRGKGNKIFGIPTRKALSGEETLVAIAVVAPGQALRILSGGRHMGLSFRELEQYRGERGQRGAVLPRGWRKVDDLEVEVG